MAGVFRQITIADIMRFADRHHQMTGQWPISRDGPVLGEDGLTWEGINTCLRKGGRGLPGGTSLARVLAEHRPTVDRRRVRPDLTAKQVLEWVQSHQMRTGRWPHRESGKVREAPDVTWATVDRTLRRGGINLPGGSSLIKFLREQLGIWSSRGTRRLTEALILKWADEHFAATGKWPVVMSGPVRSHPKESWVAINGALQQGGRGLPGGSTLLQLLTKHRGAKYDPFVATLSVRQIQAWADDYHRLHHKWPTAKSGVNSQARMSWAVIDRALRRGEQGLPGGNSLSQILHSRKQKTPGPAPKPAATTEAKPQAKPKPKLNRTRKPEPTPVFSWVEWDRKYAR